jgi:hypothetical protein
MRKGTCLATMIALLGTACAPIREELQYPNGYTGYVLDQHSFVAAYSRHLQLLRATIILAMASRLATATVRDGHDADAFADYLAAASNELNYAAADIYGAEDGKACGIPADAKDGPCKVYYANFESDLPLLEARIIRVMVSSLPEARAKQFLTDVSKGNALGAALTAIRTVYQSAVGLDRAAGVYRSGLELTASDVNCVSGTFDPKIDTVLAAARCLGLPQDKLTHVSASLEERSGADGQFPLGALMLIAETSCAHLPITTDGSAPGQVDRRNADCDLVTFKPKIRPVRVEVPGKPVEAKPAVAAVVPPPGGSSNH